ncbi:hypothetical protein GYB22_03600 [bacterium]|nr:hypothetical protein [bacterium]
MEELIEKYLVGLLSSDEKSDFERKMKADPKLEQEVEIQKQVTDAARISGLRNQVQRAYKGYQFTKVFKAVVVIVTAAAILGTATWFLTHDKEESDTPIQIEALDETVFMLNSDQDTVIETENGLILSIPAGTFGEGDYELKVNEAYDALQIMEAGLSTMSDSSLLETAGMFKLEAKRGGAAIDIAKGKEITAMLRSAEVDPEMQLFEGEETEDGVNWVKPKPLPKYLLTRDFADLDFYPPNYLKTLAEHGIDVSNKAVTDSIYYSFVCDLPELSEDRVIRLYNSEVRGEVDDVAPVDAPSRNSSSELMRFMQYEPDTERAIDDVPQDSSSVPRKRQICPASIQALQTAEFSKSFIATEEFTERLKYIFGTCNEEFLQVYVVNLDKPLWYSDSIIASRFGGSVWTAFYHQKLGNTEQANPGFAKLNQYFKRKRAKFNQAALKARQKLAKEFNKAEKEYRKAESERAKASDEDSKANFKEEYEINLKEACRQANITYVKPNRRYNQGYVMPIRSTGWKNIDRFAMEVTQSRESSSGTFNGKEVKLTYYTVNLDVPQSESYDFVKAYVIPTELRSFERMKKKDAGFTYQVNSLIEYELVSIAKKNEEYFIYKTQLEQGDKTYSAQYSKVSKE